MTTPDVNIIVVAFHGADDLRTCLSACATDFSTLVVDNSSSEAVRRVVIDVGAEYVDAEANIGFAAGVNLGLSLAPVDFDVFLLNPDARLDVAGVRTLHARLHADPALAAVSPRLLRDDGSAERVVWPFPTPGAMWKEALGLRRWRRSPSSFVVGACLLLKATALREIGGFDERFFLYAEETDWQRRASLRGWRVAEVPEVSAWHRGAGTSSDARQREALFHAGTETYIRKWHGRVGWVFYRAAAAFGAALRVAVLRGEPRSLAMRRLILYVRGPRRAANLAR